MVGKDLWLFGTFKDRLTRSATVQLLTAVRPELARHAGTSLHLGIAPTFLALPSGADVLAGSGVALTGQDCTWADTVSFTGGTSCAALAELGVTHVILGHSERRLYLGETDEMVSRKAATAIAAGLVPIVCVGEFYDDYVNGRAEEAIGNQVHALAPALAGAPAAAAILAYEPAWAISTSKQGLTCDPELARARHALIRQILGESVTPDFAAAVRILYGGSVDGSNAAGYFALDGVDGGLVGSASQTEPKLRALLDAAAGVAAPRI
jgi:triosephosphate isomerase (TIM)